MGAQPTTHVANGSPYPIWAKLPPSRPSITSKFRPDGTQFRTITPLEAIYFHKRIDLVTHPLTKVPIDDFNQIDRYFVSFLCSTYFLFTAILTINIFIGLISNALQTDGFSTVEARFVIERVEVILNYEWRLSKRKRLQRLQIQEMLHRQCAPLQVNWKDINFDAHVHGQPATRTTDTVLHQPSSSTKQAVSKRPSIAHSVISSAHSQEQLAPTSVISLIYEIPSTPHIPQQSNQVLLEEIQKLRELVEKSLQEKRLSTASSTLEAPTVGIMRKSTQPSKQSQSQPPLQSSFVI
ncbi:unnamed protein product [Didymodactylos carnosus]|uniref:Ion transport domain-containing protein n=1 Tax=Didymodactylos carnosus TaxID=1234261 RepID=A0A815BBD6_9BILA|nr:unnamed protein product [Didymodactylos carnosus]CAF4053639.1 unnamed protein product [Didymodactylos carnosus]